MSAIVTKRPRTPTQEALAYLASLLGRDREEGGVSPDDRAELRRMGPLDAALPPAMWRLLSAPDLVACVRDIAPANWTEGERALAILVQAMMESGASGDERIGAALAASGYAEQRFIRLLRARGPADVADQARLAARWCATKGEGLRFTDRYRLDGFGPFILEAALSGRDADRRAHAIARNYFAIPQPAAPAAGAPALTES